VALKRVEHQVEEAWLVDPYSRLATIIVTFEVGGRYKWLWSLKILNYSFGDDFLITATG